MTMYCLLAVAFIAFTTAIPVPETHSVLAATDIEDIDCLEAVSNLNIEGILKNFGNDDKRSILTAMKSAAKVQCGVLTGRVRPKGVFKGCADKCIQLNIQGILKQFGSDYKASIWRAMKGACFGECDAIHKQADTVTDSSVRAATASSDNITQSQNQTSHSVKKDYYGWSYSYECPSWRCWPPSPPPYGTYSYDVAHQPGAQPSPPPAPPRAPGQLLWTVTSGKDFCHVTPDGLCVTDGDDSYHKNEDCTFKADAQMTLTVKTFQTESDYDYLRVGSERYTGTSGPDGKLVDADTQFVWHTDSSVKWRGFEICGQLSSSPPSPPPLAPAHTADETQCKSQVANLNIESILKHFGHDNKRAILTAMKEAAMTQCYINANYRVYKPSGASMMVCKEKCGNLNIQNVQKQFGKVSKQAIVASMKSACHVECDNMYEAD
jgi:hypothetical protein